MDTLVDTTVDVPLACEVCGRQDETIRFVSYPYVFSIVVVTFQRAFFGCWCRIHRIQRWLAASLITSIFGWMGFPFGLLFTPVRLVQLARGGLQDKTTNGRLLRLIGEKKSRNGDTQGAIRCLEASLLYADELEVNQQLRNLYRSQSTAEEVTTYGLLSVVVFPAILITFASVGILVGFVDFIIRWLSSLLASEISIYLMILLQVPFMTLVYFCIVLIGYAFQAAIYFTKSNSRLFLSVASVITSLLFLNGIISGATYGIYFNYVINGFREVLEEMLISLGAILTRASFYIFSSASLSSNFEANILYAILLVLSFTFSLLVLLPRIRDLSSQQLRKAELQSAEGQTYHVNSFPGWTGLMSVVLIFALLFAATPQQSSVDSLEAFDHIQFALSHISLGESEQAIAEYERAIELRPRFPLSYVGLGYVHYFAGDLANAKENFEFAISLQNDLAEAHSGLGWVYSNEGENELAQQAFEDALRINPYQVDGHLGLGWLFLLRYELEKSQDEFEYVISLAPEVAEGYYGLGTVEMTRLDYDRAIALFDQTLQLNPSITFAHVYKGFMYHGQDNYSEAENAFQAALQLEPNNYLALNGLGDIRIAHYAFEDGLDYYDLAIAAAPERVEAYVNKAGILAQMGEFDKALSLLEPHEESDVRIKPYLAFLQYELGNEELADDLLEESILASSNLDPINQSTLDFWIASIFAGTNRFDRAEEFLTSALDANPQGLSEEFFLLQASIFSAQGEYTHAKEVLETLESVGHSEITLHLARASILIDQEKLMDADQEIQLVLGLDSQSARAHAMGAFVLNQQTRYPEAISEANRAIELNPYNASAYTELAIAYYETGKIDQALVEAQNAVGLSQLHYTAHYILGVCYMELGMNPEAVEEFEFFLDNYWDRTYLREYKIKAEAYLEQLQQSPDDT